MRITRYITKGAQFGPAGILLLAAGGCNSMASASKDDQPYRFVLGTTSALPEGRTNPVRITVPARFIEMDRPAGQGEIELAQVTFPFHFPDKTPVAHDALGEDNVVLATFSWEPPGSVRRRIDGSWLNHYSRYSVKGERAYGLATAKAADPIDTSVLFSSIEDQVMIECNSIREEPLQWCHLISNPSSYLAVEARFRAKILPRWREIISHSLSLVSIK
jgi:hypothetical protein